MPGIYTFVEQILSRYRDGIYSSIEDNDGLVGEYFNKFDDDKGSRLLCQTRCVYFLSKMYEQFNDKHALETAFNLNRELESKYRVEGVWRSKRYTSIATKDLYELSSLTLSQLFLYKSTNEKDIRESVVATLSKIISIIDQKNLFPAFAFYKGLVSQNPLMHTFESLFAAFSILESEIYLEAAAKVLNIVEQNFFDLKVGLLFEVSSSNCANPWYEPGHAFEWATLLFLAANRDLIFKSKIQASKLLASAEKVGVSNDLVVSKIYKGGLEKEFSFRIWPQLERVRAFLVSGMQDKGNLVLDSVLLKFFDNDGFPIEYLNQEINKVRVKTTTGYHIINCFQELSTEQN